MPEIQPDLSDESRCISVHWALPVQCVLPCTHAEVWHEAWHPETGNRIRYRRSMGVFRTEELHSDAWHDLEIPPPGEVCGEPHGDKPGVFCQWPRTHNERSWTHRALFEGCTYTWNTIGREPTPEQVAQDLSRVREIAAAQAAKLTEARQALLDEEYQKNRWISDAASWERCAGELDTEVQRLRGELERLNRHYERERAARINAEGQVHRVMTVKVWTNEDRKKFVFADALWEAMNGDEGTRPAAAAHEVVARPS